MKWIYAYFLSTTKKIVCIHIYTNSRIWNYRNCLAFYRNPWYTTRTFIRHHIINEMLLAYLVATPVKNIFSTLSYLSHRKFNGNLELQGRKLINKSITMVHRIGLSWFDSCNLNLCIVRSIEPRTITTTPVACGGDSIRFIKNRLSNDTCYSGFLD